MFGPLAPFFPRFWIHGDFEDAGEVLHHVEVVFEQIDRAFSSRIASGLVCARFDQQCRAFSAAKKDSAVERGVFAFITVALVGVRSCFQEFGDRLGMSGVARPSQRGLPQEWVLGVDIRFLVEETVNFVKIAKSRGRPQAVGCFGSLFLSTAIRDNDGCPSERDDGEHAHDQGQQDAFHTVNQKATQATPLPKHGGKEAAEQKEQWHAKAMDDVVDFHERRPSVIHSGPDGDAGVGQRSMQHNAQQHGPGPQGVKIVAAFVHTRQDTLGA